MYRGVGGEGGGCTLYEKPCMLKCARAKLHGYDHVGRTVRFKSSHRSSAGRRQNGVRAVSDPDKRYIKTRRGNWESFSVVEHGAYLNGRCAVASLHDNDGAFVWGLYTLETPYTTFKLPFRVGKCNRRMNKEMHKRHIV